MRTALKRIRPGFGVVLLAGLLLGPLALLVALRLGSTGTLPGVTFDPAPVLTTGTARQITSEQAVRVVPAWDQGKDLYAPAWSGVATAVYASASAPLKSGDRVLAIDNVDRIAYASATPFYRAISSGDSGPDVTALNQMLVTLGYLDASPSDPSVATFATGQAVRDFATKLGASSTATFDPGWVVWLPADPFPLATLSVSDGQPAPPPGSVLGAGRSTLTGATIAAAGQEPLDIDTSVQWVVVVDSKSFGVDPVKLAVDPAALANLAPLLPQPTSGGPGAAGAGGLPGTSSNGVSGTLQRATPLDAVAIPSTAVMVGARGNLCVWVPDGRGYRAVAVVVDGASAGVTNAVSGLQPGEELLANPGVALKDPKCP